MTLFIFYFLIIFELDKFAFLGVIILCLPLILKQSLIWLFNISFALKAYKQDRKKVFFHKHSVLFFLLLSIISQYIFLHSIFLIHTLYVFPYFHNQKRQCWWSCFYSWFCEYFWFLLDILFVRVTFSSTFLLFWILLG